MECTATLHAGCELSSATGSGTKSSKGTGEGGDDQENLFHGFVKVKGATLVPAFFFFSFFDCTAREFLGTSVDTG